jgi:hypothetical protein
MMQARGGDEFGIVHPRSTEALAAEAAQRLLGAIGRPFEINGICVHVGVSIGIALSANDQDFQGRCRARMPRCTTPSAPAPAMDSGAVRRCRMPVRNRFRRLCDQI